MTFRGGATSQFRDSCIVSVQKRLFIVAWTMIMIVICIVICARLRTVASNESRLKKTCHGTFSSCIATMPLSVARRPHDLSKRASKFDVEVRVNKGIASAVEVR